MKFTQRKLALAIVTALAGTASTVVYAGNMTDLGMTNPSSTSADGLSTTITIDGSDDKGMTSSYQIVRTSHVGNTWTYTVTGLKGRDLSHWALGGPFTSCLSHITSSTSGAAPGADGSTGFNGIKWDTKGGTFSFTLDNNYPAT
jgi:hypothetical protein